MPMKKYSSTFEAAQDKILQEIELKIQTGNKTTAAKALNNLIKKNKLDSQRLRIANLLRRAGQPYKSLIILRPLVLKELAKPSPAEIIAYSAGLYQIGQSKEARNRLLNILNNNSNLSILEKSDVLFHLGLLEMSEWNYHKASHYFEKLVRPEMIKNYRFYLSLMNLSSCYIFYGKLVQAEEKLNQILAWEYIANYSVLKNSCLDGLAQIKIYQKDFVGAKTVLNQADKETIHLSELSTQRLQILKWICINNLYQNYNIAENLSRLTELSQIAKTNRYIELQRDCDFYFAFFKLDKNRLNQIFHGTSVNGFKKKLLYHCPNFQPKNEWSWSLQSSKTDNSILPIVIHIDDNFLRHWSSLQTKTILLLLRDQYRSFTIGEIFSCIHQDEHFDPLTSSARIRKHLWGINKKLARLGFQFRIQAYFNSFYFSAKQPILLQANVSLDMLLVNSIKHKYIISPIAKKWLSCLELIQITGWSKAKVHRWLNELIKNNKVKTRGTYKDKKYFLVSV